MTTSVLRAFADRLLGRGSAAITVPVMDGLLKANRALDDAEVVAECPGIDDLASDGATLWVSAGPVLLRVDGATVTPLQRFDATISAIAAHPTGRVAVALAGRQVRVFASRDDVLKDVATFDRCAGTPLVCVNALAFDGPEQLVFSEGSQRHGPDDWCRDLMTLGATGRVGRWRHGQGAEATELASGLRHAYGVLPTADGVRVSESWRHRVLNVDRTAPVLAELPGYPSRMTPAAGGGFWLACFVCRTQLVEFVLREPAYRERMVAEIDPRYWIAPALSSGHSFLEPLQGAGVKTMGVVKPWAPPRSYGLVVKVGADGAIAGSLHSQVDGRHHGITGVTEHDGRLYAASKGAGRLLAIDPGEIRWTR